MNADRLLAHYERIAGAPEAIPRLRRFILELGVRGKLIDHSDGTESASELLNQIAAEKALLVKTGAIKQQKPLPSVSPDELSIDLPPHWTLARLADVAVCLDYKRKPINGAERKRRIEGKSPEQLYPYFGATRQQGWIDDYLFDEELVLLGEDGVPFFDAYRNKSYVISGKTWVNNHAHVFKAILVSHSFLAHYLNVFDYSGRVAGATRSKLNQARAVDIPLPLPPLAEQHRIVTKVDELFALCDQLETTLSERDRIRIRLTNVSMARLNASDPDEATFQNHAAFALAHLPLLTTDPEQVKDLRQAILNLAIRGKLVEQDPNDEPASELLRQTAAEKMRLTKTKQIKGRRPPKPATSSDVDFNLPVGWSPVNIAQLLVDIQTGPFGSSLHQSDYQEGGVPVINPASIQNGRIVPIGKMAVASTTLVRLASFRLQTGDIIVGRRGEMGRCAAVTEREQGWLCGTGSLILRPLEVIYPRFLSMFIGSPFSRQYPGGTAIGTTMQNLNQAILLKLSFGLPPLSEQHRIVAKVDELMALCNRLEESLTIGMDTHCRFLDAILHEVLAPDADSKVTT